MTEEIKTRQTAEATSAVPSAQTGITGGARSGAERTAVEFNTYLYENLVSNVEAQIEHWTRKASHESDREVSKAFRLKAEGLAYALRLLSAFEPEFRQLVMLALHDVPEGRASHDTRVHRAADGLGCHLSLCPNRKARVLDENPNRTFRVLFVSFVLAHEAPFQFRTVMESRDGMEQEWVSWYARGDSNTRPLAS